MYTYDENTISDLYKDTFGHRPDPIWRSIWKDANQDLKQKIWDGLIVEFDEAMERERIRQEKAVVRFEKRVAANMKLGAPTREDAIRWILQSMNLSEQDLAYGASYVCYELDLPYSMSPDLEPIVKLLKAA